MASTTRITVFVDQDLFNKLQAVTSDIGLSKESLLSSTLPAEIAYLKKIPANGPKAARWFRAISKVRAEKRRLNITLSKKGADAMRRLCKAKGITRDQFISEYISFLVEGDPAGSCPGPLSKIDALLADPRFEYYTMDGSNPYDDLHMTEEEAEKIAVSLREMIQSGESDDSAAQNN